MAQSAKRSRGVVLWFNDQKGYGFIKPDDGGEDLFVHQSSIQSQGFRTLKENDVVEFTLASGDNNNKPKAVDVTGPNGAPISNSGSGFGGLRRGGYGFGDGGNGGGWRRDGDRYGGECYSCGRAGHLARDCPNSYSGGGGANCYNCGQPGHLARDCMEGGRGGGGGSGACFNCGGYGHMARDCRQGGDGFGRFGGGRGGGGGCYNCGEVGHMARDCTNP